MLLTRFITKKKYNLQNTLFIYLKSPLLLVVFRVDRLLNQIPITLCKASLVNGIIRGDEEHKVSLCADDLLFIWIGTRYIWAYLCLEIKSTQRYFFLINEAAHNHLLKLLPFKVSRDNLTYLGVNVTSRFGKLFKSNSSDLLTHTKLMFVGFSSLSLWLARYLHKNECM